MPRVIHFEIGADNVDRATKFYSDVFGWKFNKAMSGDDQDYWLIETGPMQNPGINGGLFKRPGPLNVSIINTIDVPDIDEFISKVEKGGGKIVMPKSVISGIGYLAYFEDPEGNYFGIMEPDMSAK